MSKDSFLSAIKSLPERGVFALLVVLTEEGETVLRPIGGRWGSGIVDAVKEMSEKYPGCRMKLFEQNYDDWERYFRGIISKKQLL
ncbi:hypothetical protein H0A61_03010 [Koleobacter methoxysyntrophicus]|uniref:Uncharacterized protein n=1 Tax=Koleobacter methoxysyntrophicus TaxID=2751313 RepID=A0A8A0RSU0_9FIRM|nr:hypothetical protein [Koleobacter methoxysyntrophicus]QSQ10600.1 hypothetical protein H0A61_03010 [Koleobacter methoxysyntrophicus]